MLGSSSKVSIRKSRPSDADDLANIFCQTWQETYRGIIPHHYLQTMVSRRNKRWWERTIRAGCNVLVVESPAGLAGYATWAPTRTLRNCQGEIYELYVQPSHQGCGFGELLFEGCRARLDQQSRDGLIVWSLLDNTPAIDFYWRRGGRPVAHAFDRLGGAQLEKVAFCWK